MIICEWAPGAADRMLTILEDTEAAVRGGEIALTDEAWNLIVDIANWHRAGRPGKGLAPHAEDACTQIKVLACARDLASEQLAQERNEEYAPPERVFAVG